MSKIHPEPKEMTPEEKEWYTRCREPEAVQMARQVMALESIAESLQLIRRELAGISENGRKHP